MIRARTMLVLSLVVTLVAGSAAFAALPVAASIGISITPSVLELSAKPGATGRQVITVSNSGDQPYDATVQVESLEGATDTTDATAWLKVSPAAFHLEPKQNQKLTVSMQVPSGLASGGYYAFITITTSAMASKGQAAGVAGQLGVPVLFTIDGKGKVESAAELERFAPVLEPDGRLGFRAKVRSSGNVYITTQGKVQIASASGKKYASLDFPDSGRILPGAEKILQTQGSVPAQQGATYSATAALTYGDAQKLNGETKFTMDIPALAVANMSVCENLDTGPTLAFGLKDDGTLGAQPNVTLAIKDASGAQIGATEIPAVLVWPQDTSMFSINYTQRLESGNYTLSVSAQLGNLTPVTKDFPFQIGGLGGNPVPLCTAGTPAA